MLSVTLPTSSLAFTVATNAALTRMSAFSTVRKPGSSNFTEYEPGGSRSNRYDPVASVTCDCGPPMSRSPASVTVTPGRTALLESDTMPTIDPVWTCACALAAASRTAAQITIRLTVFICLLRTTHPEYECDPATIRGNSYKVKNL